MQEDKEDPRCFYADRQKEGFLKKFVPSDCDQSNLDDLTYEKFRNVNEHMAGFKDIVFPDPAMRLTSSTHYHDKVLLRARSLMHFVLGTVTIEELFTACKQSGGSSIGVPFVDTSLEAKFRYPISVTAGVKPLVEAYLTFDQKLAEAIEDLNRGSTSPRFAIVDGSRATTVDKTTEIKRMIAVEPTWNMFFQQGLMVILYARMKVVGLDVETLPDLHKELARLASIDGFNATVDWSSASDCMLRELLNWLMPPKWFNLCDRVRSPKMDLQGTMMELNMFSTMGNAVTFPLETLVFWTMAHATILSQNPKTNTLFPEYRVWKSVSVFGDDCILPCHWTPAFLDVMSSVGFIVNDEKSFYDPSGSFRESCGGDYLAGYNVRPISLRAPHSDRLSSLEPWLYIVLNGVVEKWISHFGPLTYVYDKAFFRAVLDLFREHNLEFKVVPSFYPDDSGFRDRGDMVRFLREYLGEVKLAKIRVSKQGTVKFPFCNFQYNESRRKHGGIRFATWLKASLAQYHVPDVSAVSDFYKRRRLGGYVVASGLTAHWVASHMEVRPV
jgi:hypothetical protein